MGDLGSIPELGGYPGGGIVNPLQDYCLENPHGQKCLAGYSPWGHTESKTTEWRRKHIYASELHLGCWCSCIQGYPGSVQFSCSVMSNSLQNNGLQQPGFPVYHQLVELAQPHFHRVGVGIQPSYPLSSASLPAFNLSQNQVLSSESVLHIRWPKYCNFSFSLRPSN